MYRAPSKRQQLIKRVLVYGAMTSTVLLLVTLLVFVMLGYRFNQTTSTIEQGGLVQFNSRPSGAKITVGSAKLSAQTPSKITVNPGSYTVTMQKEGYHTWSKLSDVSAGQVLWLNYAQLIPKKITTQPVKTFENLDSAVISPNSERYALLLDSSEPIITFADITDDQPELTTLSLPVTNADDAPKTAYTLQLWAPDSNRMLLTAKTGNVTEWLLVDRRDSTETVNLSKQFSSTIVEAQFDPRSSDRLVVRTKAGELRMIDTANNTLSGVMASSVTGMSLYGNDAILVVQKVTDTTQQIGYVSYGSTTVRELQDVEGADPVKVAGATYFGDPYIAITIGTELKISQIRNLPSSDSETPISMTSVAATTLPAVPSYLSVRTNGRFVLAQHQSGLTTYDIELKKQSQTSFKKPVVSELRWLDRYHFYVTNSESLDIIEFDGGNPHTVTKSTSQFDAVSRENGKYIYSFTTADDKTVVLQRSQMILDN